ncbi:MAG: hypothetical protein AAF092_00060 [Pseudomonadota bacterium]
MRRLIPFALALTVPVATTAAAETCPAAKDIAAAETALYRDIQQLPGGRGVNDYTVRLWELWTMAPDARAQAHLDAGMSAIRFGDFGRAEAELDALIAYCPHYAEGYNQRAFAHYLQYEYADALTLLDEAEKRAPRHTGVLTGKALTLINMGRSDDAQEPLRRAVRLNPWLSERALLVEPPGEDL